MPINPVAVEPAFQKCGWSIFVCFFIYGLLYVILQTYMQCGIAPPMTITQTTKWGALPNLWFCAVKSAPTTSEELITFLRNSKISIYAGDLHSNDVRLSYRSLGSLAESGRGFGHNDEFASGFRARVNISDLSSVPCILYETGKIGLNQSDVKEADVRFMTTVPVLPQRSKFMVLAESVGEELDPWVSVVVEMVSLTGNTWMPQEVQLKKEIHETRGLLPWNVPRHEMFRSSLLSSLPPLDHVPDDSHGIVQIRLLAFYRPVQIQTTSNVIWTLYDVASSFGGQVTILTSVWAMIFVYKYKESARLTVRGQAIKGALIQVPGVDEVDSEGEEEYDQLEEESEA